MSSAEESELKGGHPPAVKAGGMRIQQKPRPHRNSEKDPNADEGDDHINTLTASTSPPKATKVSGALMRGNADFPTEAVQHTHKLPPTHCAVPPAHSKHQHIQQPRKEWKNQCDGEVFVAF